MAKILVLIIFLFSIYFVISPLLYTKSKRLKVSDSEKNLLFEKNILYKQIKELEMDFNLGNISKEDLEKSRNRMKKEISLIFEKLNARSS